MRSYHFEVKVFQMGKWTSSFGILDLRYMLEIMKQLHIDFRGKVVENLGVELLG